MFNTQLDFEGGTLAWQAERIDREVKTFRERYKAQEDRNKEVLLFDLIEDLFINLLHFWERKREVLNGMILAADLNKFDMIYPVIVSSIK